MIHDLERRVDDSVAAVRAHSDLEPRVGIVLGTGLGALTDMIDTDAVAPYEDLPGFPAPTVESHSGRLVLGTLGDTPVAAMQGRFHRYEGYTLQEITFPVRVLRRLGADTLVVSNVSGGMNPLWRVGELVVLDDHINLLGDSPLIGPNADAFGPRFPDMSEPYDRALQDMAVDVALELGIRLNRGVYVAVPGPQLETRAEYRMLRTLGADVVGMSTVPEVIVARHMEMRVLGLSIITDACLPDALEPVDVSAILAAAAQAEPDLTRIIERVVGRL
ncbi:MAG: purine-nucleoside phosphorylase [Longimicrobiales bacterium]|nr:purine-nucleoside phosphorylase [Longimicrobiales bacterium]